MNLVVDDTVGVRTDGSKHNISMVVSRGNSIVMLEALDRVEIYIPENV
jgi:hypothetical protein